MERSLDAKQHVELSGIHAFIRSFHSNISGEPSNTSIKSPTHTRSKPLRGGAFRDLAVAFWRRWCNRKRANYHGQSETVLVVLVQRVVIGQAVAATGTYIHRAGL